MAKTKALISFAVTAKLICVFVFAYAKIRFSHDAAHMLHVYYHHFQRSSSLKQLSQSKPNFMWSLLRKAERKNIFINVSGHKTKMAAMLQKSFPTELIVQ